MPLTNGPRAASSTITGRGSAILQPTAGAVRLSPYGAGSNTTPTSALALDSTVTGIFQTYLIKSNLNSVYAGTDNAGLGIQPMDNITMNNSLNLMYKFAQTTMSMLPMMIRQTIPLPSGRGDYTRIGDVDLRVKTQEAAPTPNTNMQIDRRDIQETIMEQGFTEGLDTARRGIMRVTSYFQESVAYAIARNMDKWVQIACTDNVGIKSSLVTDTYYGNNTYTTLEFPDANRFVRTNNQAAGNSKVTSFSPDAKAADNQGQLIPGEQFLDDLKEVLTTKNLNPAEVVIIGSRNLEKQIQQIVAFRNMDNTLHYKQAFSNTGDLWWHGLNFVFLNYDCYINGNTQFAGKSFDQAGKVSGATSVPSGYRPLGATVADGELKNTETCLVVHFSGLIRGLTGANFIGLAKRKDYSWANQIYIKVGAAFSRMDEDKVIQILYKKSTNSLVA